MITTTCLILWMPTAGTEMLEEVDVCVDTRRRCEEPPQPASSSAVSAAQMGATRPACTNGPRAFLVRGEAARLDCAARANVCLEDVLQRRRGRDRTVRESQAASWA